MAGCTCGACGLRFSGVSVFDRHRHLRGEHGGCLDPAEIEGLELRDGVWSGPAMSATARARVRSTR